MSESRSTRRMRARNQIVTVCVITALVLYQHVLLSAPPCYGPNPDAATKGYVGSDEKVHVGVYIEPGTNANIVNAVEAAMNMWNDHSGLTLTVFELTGDAGTAGVRVEYSGPGGCGAYNPGGSITYNWELEEVAEYSLEWGTWAMAHELGHWVGMGEAGTNTPSTATVMNNVVIPLGWRCINAMLDASFAPATLNVLGADAWQARWCLGAMRTGSNFPRPPEQYEARPVGPGSGCTWYEIWQITIIFRCDDGCYYYDYDEVFLGYACG